MDNSPVEGVTGNYMVIILNAFQGAFEIGWINKIKKNSLIVGTVIIIAVSFRLLLKLL